MSLQNISVQPAQAVHPAQACSTRADHNNVVLRCRQAPASACNARSLTISLHSQNSRLILLSKDRVIVVHNIIHTMYLNSRKERDSRHKHVVVRNFTSFNL